MGPCLLIWSWRASKRPVSSAQNMLMPVRNIHTTEYSTTRPRQTRVWVGFSISLPAHGQPTAGFFWKYPGCWDNNKAGITCIHIYLTQSTCILDNSPNLNPIEEFFAELKAFIRRNWKSYEENPEQGFDNFLEWCINVVGAKEQSAEVHFRHAGLTIEEIYTI